MRNLEEDLDHILSDADLEEYIKIGIQIKSIEKEKVDLVQKENRIHKEIDQISKEVLQRINGIKHNFDDIMKEVISSDIIND